MDLTPIETVLTIAGTIGASLLGFYRWLRPRLRAFREHMAALDNIPDLTSDVKAIKDQLSSNNIPGLAKDVRSIKAEVMPNGGTSLRDAVNRMENRLMVQGQMSEYMLSAHNLGFWMNDPAGHAIRIGRDFCRIVGWSESELLGLSWITRVHRDDRDEVADEWEAMVRDKREFDMNFRFVSQMGVTVPVHVRAHPLKVRDIEGFFATIVPAQR